MELNNGTSSGGTYVDTDRQSLLINMLQIMQNAHDLSQMEKQLNATQADFSLIVNTANNVQTKSYEFSSTLGMKGWFPQPNTTFASTNFYLNPAWQNIPAPTDATTWMGVTRRNHLLTSAAEGGVFDMTRFEALIDKRIQNGGARWKMTIYQMIYNTYDGSLYLKVNSKPKAG